MSVLVNNNDLVLLGHGSYPGGQFNMLLPKNIDLYILSPVGYALTTSVAETLIDQIEIKTLTLHHDNGSGNTIIEPPFVIYTGGSYSPDFTLYNLGDLSSWGEVVIGEKENVVTVDNPTLLSDLIKTDSKIQDALRKLGDGEKLKLYWSACVNQVSGNYADLH